MGPIKLDKTQEIILCIFGFPLICLAYVAKHPKRALFIGLGITGAFAAGYYWRNRQLHN